MGIRIHYGDKEKFYDFSPIPAPEKGGVIAGGMPIKVAELPIPTEQDVGKVYLLEKVIPLEVGQMIGDKLYFDTTKNPSDYEISTTIPGGMIFQCENSIFATIFYLNDNKTTYILAVGKDDKILDVPYAYSSIHTPKELNDNLESMFGKLPNTITEFGWQTDAVDTTSVKGSTITSIGKSTELVKGTETVSEYYVTKKSTFEVGTPLGNKIRFDTTKNPVDYPACVEKPMMIMSNGQASNFLAMMDYAPIMELPEDTHIYALFLADETSALLGLAYLDTCNTLTLEQINEMLAPAFGMTLTKFGWQTDLLDTSAFADYVVVENNLADWDYLAYGTVEIDALDTLAPFLEKSLTVLNSNATAIRPYACSYCTTLTSVNLPKAKSIGEYAFALCGALSKVNIPEVTRLEYGAFQQCEALTSINLPKVTYIGKDSLTCQYLRTITLGSTTPPTLGDDIIENCLTVNIESIYVPAESVDAYSNADGWKWQSGKIKPIPQ